MSTVGRFLPLKVACIIGVEWPLLMKAAVQNRDPEKASTSDRLKAESCSSDIGFQIIADQRLH